MFKKKYTLGSSDKALIDSSLKLSIKGLFKSNDSIVKGIPSEYFKYYKEDYYGKNNY